MKEGIQKHLEHLRQVRKSAFDQCELDEEHHARNRQKLQELDDIIDALDPPTRTNSNNGCMY